MKYRAIIRESWTLTQENKKLIWWFAFVPALLTLLVGMVYMAYQVLSLWNSPYIRSGAAETHFLKDLFVKAFDFYEASPSLAVLGVILVAIVGLAYLILPVFTQGALIQLVAHLRAGEPLSIAKGISYGFTRFLQLFEYHLFIKTFSLVSILTEVSFAFRVLGPEPFRIFGWIFLLVIIVGLILTLLVTYSEYYIVIDKTGMFSSVIKSAGLVIRQWHHTLFMLLLMAFIIVRIALNVIAVLLIPALVITPLFLFDNVLFINIGTAVGVVMGLVILYFASYFLGVFHVFTTTVWTFTFLELTHAEENEVNLHEAAVQN